MSEPSAPPPAGPPAATGQSSRQRRKVEPVSDEFSPEEVFDPESQARPVAAGVLLAGPVLAVLGVLVWLRLIAGVPLPLEKPGVNWLGLGADLFMALLFVLTHSILSRGIGRRWLNHPLGPEGERPLFVLVSGALLTLLGFAWTTTGPLLWDHEGFLGMAARALQVAALGLAAWAAVVSGAGRLLALPQLRNLETGRQTPPPELVALPPYRWLRQPMNLGFLVLLAAMPEATLDRLVLAVVFGLWILLAVPWEERDARVRFGEAYDLYKERTPRWIPVFRNPEES